MEISNGFSLSPAISILSPYFFGASFESNHFRVSTLTLRLAGSSSFSSDISIVSSAIASSPSARACA